MQPTTLPQNEAGDIKLDLQNYNNWRRTDLEYAIIWNRQKGKDIPPAKDNVSKDKLVSFCDYHNVEMSLCEFTTNLLNETRVKRPPREVQEEPQSDVRVVQLTTEAQEEEVEEPKNLEDMTINELKSIAKTRGINSYGKSKEKILEELKEA